MAGTGNYKVICSVETEECSFRLLRLEKNQTVNPHHHHRTTQTYFVVEGVVEASVEGRPRTLRQYDVLRIAHDVIHSLRPVESATVLSISTPPLQMDDQHLVG